MIRCRYKGYSARKKFGDEPTLACGPESDKDSVWCADRYGQSFTYLPDGRVIEIAGEHEDSYDPDFYIYNDVFVHEPGGRTRIFIYPKAVFPPTDFHSATLVGKWIYIVGSFGYQDDRVGQCISVYRLNTEDYHIELVETQGSPKFQLYEHDAKQEENFLVLTGGIAFAGTGQNEQTTPNTQTIKLDLQTLTWSVKS